MTHKHFARITFSDGLSRVDWVCKAPKRSFCHVEWDCECETFVNQQMRRGVPAHQPWGAEDDEWHVGHFNKKQCNYEPWFSDDSEALYGEVEVPVTPTFEGEWYSFTIAAGKVKVRK